MTKKLTVDSNISLSEEARREILETIIKAGISNNDDSNTTPSDDSSTTSPGKSIIYLENLEINYKKILFHNFRNFIDESITIELPKKINKDETENLYKNSNVLKKLINDIISNQNTGKKLDFKYLLYSYFWKNELENKQGDENTIKMGMRFKSPTACSKEDYEFVDIIQYTKKIKEDISYDGGRLNNSIRTYPEMFDPLKDIGEGEFNKEWLKNFKFTVEDDNENEQSFINYINELKKISSKKLKKDRWEKEKDITRLFSSLVKIPEEFINNLNETDFLTSKVISKKGETSCATAGCTSITFEFDREEGVRQVRRIYTEDANGKIISWYFPTTSEHEFYGDGSGIVRRICVTITENNINQYGSCDGNENGTFAPDSLFYLNVKAIHKDTDGVVTYENPVLNKIVNKCDAVYTWEHSDGLSICKNAKKQKMPHGISWNKIGIISSSNEKNEFYHPVSSRLVFPTNNALFPFTLSFNIWENEALIKYLKYEPKYVHFFIDKKIKFSYKITDNIIPPVINKNLVYIGCHIIPPQGFINSSHTTNNINKDMIQSLKILNEQIKLNREDSVSDLFDIAHQENREHIESVAGTPSRMIILGIENSNKIAISILDDIIDLLSKNVRRQLLPINCVTTEIKLVGKIYNIIPNDNYYYLILSDVPFNITTKDFAGLLWIGNLIRLQARPSFVSKIFIAPIINAKSKVVRHITKNNNVIDCKPNDILVNNTETQFVKNNFKDTSVNSLFEEFTPKIKVEWRKLDGDINENYKTIEHGDTRSIVHNEELLDENYNTTAAQNAVIKDDYVSIFDEEIFGDIFNKQNENKVSNELFDCNILQQHKYGEFEIVQFDNLNNDIKEFNLQPATNEVDNRLCGTISSVDIQNNINQLYRTHIIPEQKIKENTIIDGVYKTDANDEYAKNHFYSKFTPSGAHRFGYMNEDGIIVERKNLNCMDFILNGELDYIYKNMQQPVFFRKVKDGKEYIIKPKLIQAFNFRDDEIIESFKIHFSSTITNIADDTEDVIFTTGFLINKEFNENGVINTEKVQIKTGDLVDGRNYIYTPKVPIYVPAGTYFFIGITSKTKDIALAVTTDNINNLNNEVNDSILFVNDSEPIDSRNLYLRIDVNALKNFETNSTEETDSYVSPLLNDGGDTNITTTETIFEYPDQLSSIDRMIFFSNDIVPKNCEVAYSIVTLDENEYNIIPNKEFVIEKSIQGPWTFKVTLKTTRESVSPIIKPKEYGFLIKNYDTTLKKVNKMISTNKAYTENELDESFVGNKVSFTLKNLTGDYNLSTFYNGGYGEYIDGIFKYQTFLVRLNFDYFVSGNINLGSISSYFTGGLYVRARNKIHGYNIECATFNKLFKTLDLSGNDITGVTYNEKKLDDGWINRNIEFIPILKAEFISDNKKTTFDALSFINRIEEWEFDVDLLVRSSVEKNTETNEIIDMSVPIIRNIKTSVDTILFETKQCVR